MSKKKPRPCLWLLLGLPALLFLAVSCTLGVRSNISQTSQWQVGRGDLTDTRVADTSPNSVSGDKTHQDEDNLGLSQTGDVKVDSVSSKTASSASAEEKKEAPVALPAEQEKAE